MDADQEDETDHAAHRTPPMPWTHRPPDTSTGAERRLPNLPSQAAARPHAATRARARRRQATARTTPARAPRRRSSRRCARRRHLPPCPRFKNRGRPVPGACPRRVQRRACEAPPRHLHEVVPHVVDMSRTHGRRRRTRPGFQSAPRRHHAPPRRCGPFRAPPLCLLAPHRRSDTPQTRNRSSSPLIAGVVAVFPDSGSGRRRIDLLNNVASAFPACSWSTPATPGSFRRSPEVPHVLEPLLHVAVLRSPVSTSMSPPTACPFRLGERSMRHCLVESLQHAGLVLADENHGCVVLFSSRSAAHRSGTGYVGTMLGRPRFCRRHGLLCRWQSTWLAGQGGDLLQSVVLLAGQPAWARRGLGAMASSGAVQKREQRPYLS